jgi:hypothetical protein
VTGPRLSFFVHLAASPAWLAKSLPERQGIIAEDVEPLLRSHASCDGGEQPLTALSHRCPQGRNVSNTNPLRDHQRRPATQTMTSDFSAHRLDPVGSFVAQASRLRNASCRP